MITRKIAVPLSAAVAIEWVEELDELYFPGDSRLESDLGNTPFSHGQQYGSIRICDPFRES